MSSGGKVGALPDVQVVSLPRSAWEQDKTAVLEALNRADGVIKVDVQEQRQRKKRGKYVFSPWGFIRTTADPAPHHRRVLISNCR